MNLGKVLGCIFHRFKLCMISLYLKTGMFLYLHFSVAKSYCQSISDIDIDPNLPMTRLLSYIERFIS